MSDPCVRIIGALAFSVAVLSCGGGDVIVSTASTNSSTKPSVPAGNEAAVAHDGQAAREVPEGSRFVAYGLVSSSTGGMLPTTWRSSDPSIATVSGFGFFHGMVVGVRPGTAFIEGSALGTTETIRVTVLSRAPTSVVSPVVADFRMLDVGYEPGSNFWTYVPDLVLRDTTGRGGSAIIGLTVDLPGLDASPPCAMLREVGPGPLEVFQERYGDFELTIDGRGARVNGTEAVAHITLRIPGPMAMTLDVRGPIVPGTFPTTYTDGRPGDLLACG